MTRRSPSRVWELEGRWIPLLITASTAASEPAAPTTCTDPPEERTSTDRTEPGNTRCTRSVLCASAPTPAIVPKASRRATTPPTTSHVVRVSRLLIGASPWPLKKFPSTARICATPSALLREVPAGRLTHLTASQRSSRMAMTVVAPELAQASLKEISTNLPNIQGNVFGGFFKDHQAFLFLRLHDAAEARTWLADLIDDIATSEEVIAFNNAFKLTKARHHGREGVVKATWTNVAFTFQGLQALGAPD